MPERPRESELVYSADPEWQRQRAAGPAAAPATRSPAAGQQTAPIWRDSKRRRGKTVTVIGGLQHDPATLAGLLK